MRHFVPHLDLEVHALRARAFANAARVVEQDLGAADLGQRGRQATEVAEHRRHQRVVVQRVVEVERIHLPDAVG